MEVNANIYGSEDMWITVEPTNWGSNVPEEEKIKIANFTDLTPEELGNNPDPRKASALGCAAYKMSQDASWTINGDDGAFNKSVSFVGMAGNKCPYTSIKYFSNINNDQYTSNYPITQLESDTYDIVNFAFHNTRSTLRNDYGNNKRFMDIYKSSQGGGGNGNAVKDWYVRWNPDPFLGNGPSSTYPNYLNSSVSDYASSIRNQDINFVTQMPCRRVVLVPFITCSDGNDNSVGTYDLDKYLTTYKTTKPRIISVSFCAYIMYKDSDAPTSSDKRQLKYFAMSLLQSSNKFSNHYITVQGSNTRKPAENLFYPYLLMSPYIPLGGALNNGHSANNKPEGLSNQTWSSSGGFDNSTWYSVMAVCDLGDMGWTNWSGNNTGETGRGEYLYCNADNLTADEIRKSVREGLACFGMFFTDSVANAETKQLDDAGMFLGTLVDGIGYGDYTEGTANREQPQFNWKAMNENDYDPTNPPEPGGDPSASSDPMLPTGLSWTLATAGGAIWALDNLDIKQVWKDIFGKDIKLKDFGDNPMNAILSLEWTPFIWSSEISGPVVLGSQVVNPNHVYPLIESFKTAEKHASGQMKFNFNKNFYNARNMQARLFLPFYGYYELPTAQLLSSQLRVDFYYNVPDELGVYIISYDKVIYDFVECSCKIDIPLTGSNAAAIKENKKSEALTIATQVASTLVTLGNTSLSNLAGGATVNAIDRYGGVGSIMSAAQGSLGSKLSTVAAYGAGKLASTALPYAGVGITGAANIYNTVRQAQIQRAALRTNLPYHGSALQTTFLHMSMKPYVQIFKNAIMDGLTTQDSGTVKEELGDTSKAEYKLKVGHACDKFCSIKEMDYDCLLQTTGMANMSTAGMELAEVNELNAILQSGFYK